MKRKMSYLLVVVLFSSTVSPLGFDDLLGGDNDPFAGFDFNNMESMFGGGGMDFGSESDSENDPFSSLFNSGSESSLSSYSHAESSSQKKEVFPPAASSLKEAFTQSIDAKVTKLSPQFKKAMTHHLTPLITKLQGLLTHCSSFALGIKLKNDLKPSTVVINDVLQAAATLNSTSLYNLAFYQKEFSSLRESMVKAPDLIEAVNTLFAGMTAENTPSLDDTPTKSQLAERKKVFNQTESLVKKTLKPLGENLKKLFAHKSIDARVKTKKKKHTRVLKGSSASEAGGWSSNAGNYMDDYNYSGYGNSGWDSGSNFWDNDFGGGGYGDFGGYGGGYDDWGSSGSYGGNYGSSYGGSDYSSSSSNNSGKASTVYAAASPSGSQGADFDDSDDTDTPVKRRASLGAATSTETVELDPLDQIKTLLPLLIKNIPEWTKSAANTPIKQILENASFAGDVERIVRVMSLQETHADLFDEQLHAHYESFQKVLSQNCTVLIEAALYASPPFAALLEEKSLIKKEEVSQPQARAQVERAERQRTYAYNQLLQFLKLVRKNHNTGTLFALIVEKLCLEGKKILKQIKGVFAQLERKAIPSLDELISFTTLSRKVFHEPIALGYAAIAEPEKNAEYLAELKDQKESITEKIAPWVKKHYELFHTALLLVQEAVQEVRADLNLAEGQQLALTHISAIQALAKKIDLLLSTTYQDSKDATSLRSLLLPYDIQRYQHMEVEHGLLVELMQCWNGLKPEMDDTESADEAPEESEELEDAEAVSI